MGKNTKQDLRIAVRVPSEMLDDIKRLATREHRTQSDMVRELIRRAIELTSRRASA